MKKNLEYWVEGL